MEITKQKTSITSLVFGIAAILITVVAFMFLLNVEAFAQPTPTLDPEASARTGVGGGSSGAVENVGRAVTNLLSYVAGAIAVVFIIIAGFRFVTSSGDSSKVASARSAIIYASIGVIVVIFARLLVSLVFTESTTVT